MSSKDQILTTVKEWLTPILITIIGSLLWRDLSELRSDIKQLLSSQTEYKIRIENLEKEINYLKVEKYQQKTKHSLVYEYIPLVAIREKDLKIPKPKKNES